MVDITKLKQLVIEYDKRNKLPATDYSINRDRLRVLVDKHGPEATAIATGLGENTVKQHYRNDSGTAMIGSRRLDRAESVLSGM